jgi:hypothetical protein
LAGETKKITGMFGLSNSSAVAEDISVKKRFQPSFKPQLNNPKLSIQKPVNKMQSFSNLDNCLISIPLPPSQQPQQQQEPQEKLELNPSFFTPSSSSTSSSFSSSSFPDFFSDASSSNSISPPSSLPALPSTSDLRVPPSDLPPLPLSDNLPSLPVSDLPPLPTLLPNPPSLPNNIPTSPKLSVPPPFPSSDSPSLNSNAFPPLPTSSTRPPLPSTNRPPLPSSSSPAVRSTTVPSLTGGNPRPLSTIITSSSNKSPTTALQSPLAHQVKTSKSNSNIHLKSSLLKEDDSNDLQTQWEYGMLVGSEGVSSSVPTPSSPSSAPSSSLLAGITEKVTLSVLPEDIRQQIHNV